MTAPAHIAGWLERRETCAWWAAQGQDDALELLSGCDDPSVARRLREERLRGLFIAFLEDGPIARPTRVGITSSMARGGGRIDGADALRGLPADPQASPDEQREDRLRREIVALASTGADPDAWGRLLTRLHSDAEPRTHRLSFYAAVVAVNAGDRMAEAGFLADAAATSPSGSELRVSYLRVAGAALWRAGAHERAELTIRDAFDDAAENVRWAVVEDVLRLIEGCLGRRIADLAAPLGRDLIFPLLTTQPEQPMARVNIIRRVLTGTVEARAHAGDGEAVLIFGEESAHMLADVDGGAWAHGLRARALHVLGRLEEALDTLDEQLRSLRPGCAPVDQELRIPLLQKLAETGLLTRLVRLPAPGLLPEERTEAIIAAAEGLDRAGRVDAAAALLEAALGSPDSADRESRSALTRFIAVRTIVTDARSAPWRALSARLAQVERRAPELRLTAGLNLLEQGALTEAAAAIGEAAAGIAATPGMRTGVALRNLLIDVAHRARAQDHPFIAEQMLDHALAFGPPDPRLWSDEHADDAVPWARALLMRKHYERALDGIEIGIDAEPAEQGDEQTHVDLVHLWFQVQRESRKEYDDATRASLETIRQKLLRDGHEPALRDLSGLRSILRAGNGEIDGALDDLEQAVMTAPEDARSRMTRGSAVESLSQLRGAPAMRWARTVAALDPESIVGDESFRDLALALRAEAFATLGQWNMTADAATAALAAADIVGTAEHRDAVAAKLIGLVRRRGQGHPADAGPLLERILQWHPAGPAHLQLEHRLATLWARVLLGDAGHRASLLERQLDWLIRTTPSLRQPYPIGSRPPEQIRSDFPSDIPSLLSELRTIAALGEQDPITAEQLALTEMLSGSTAEWSEEEGRGWLERLAQQQPLSPIAARVHAAAAASAGDHAAVADALAQAIELGVTHSNAQLQLRRERAGALVRAGRVRQAVAELEEAFHRLVSHPAETNDGWALTLVDDLADVRSERGVENEDALYAVRASWRLWLSAARPEDIPSPDRTPGRMTRERADLRLRREWLTALHTRSQDANAASEVEEFLTLYPDDESVAWLQSMLAAAHWIQDRNVEALHAVDEALRHSGELLPERFLDLRGQIIASIDLDEPGAVEALLTRLPERIPADMRARLVQVTARRLDEAGAADAAAELLLEELSRPPISNDAALVDRLTPFIVDRDDQPAWQRMIDRALDGDDARPAGLLRTLLWKRSIRRRAAGDADGAVDDALRYARQADEPLSRRNARRLLNLARDVRELTDVLRDSILEQELALGRPRQEDDPEECRLWATTLTHAGSEDAESAWIIAVRIATERGEDETATTVSAAIDALRAAGRDNGARWERTLSRLLEIMTDLPPGSAHVRLRWARAHERHTEGDHDGAADDVTASLVLAESGRLPSARYLDAMRLGVMAAKWEQTSPAQSAEWAGEVLRISLGFRAEYTQHTVGVLRERSSAQLLTGDVTAAMDSLIEAMAVMTAEGEADPAYRDEFVLDLWRVRDELPEAGEHIVTLLTTTSDWYLAGAGTERIRIEGWLAGELLRVDAEDAAFRVWDALLETTTDAEDVVRLYERLGLQAVEAINRGAADLTLTLMGLCDRLRAPLPRTLLSGRAHLESQALLASGRIDDAFAHLRRALELALSIADPTDRV
ncbi:MAG: hypothetical protein WA971_11245, partial [Microbacterium sp.]